MPELPEVETIRQDLRGKILGKKIVRVEVLLKRIVRNDVAKFKKTLIGNSFSDILRTGKLMAFALRRGGKYLLIHLKMTGQLIYCHKDYMIAGGHSLSEKANSGKLSGCLPNKHTRAMINFADGAAIYFNDMRTFGYLELVDRRGLDKAYSNFGPDPLNSKIDAEILRKIFKNRQAPVKALLLNQKLIAGIGNIYADEILYQAGVRPDRRAKTLKPDEIKKISIAIKTIIARAVKHRGTTFNDYVDSEGRQGNFSRLLKVYGRQGKACPRCPGETVHKKKIAGRGTHYCPKCQK